MKQIFSVIQRMHGDGKPMILTVSYCNCLTIIMKTMFSHELVYGFLAPTVTLFDRNSQHGKLSRCPERSMAVVASANMRHHMVHVVCHVTRCNCHTLKH